MVPTFVNHLRTRLDAGLSFFQGPQLNSFARLD
jgi:hypothetical protein